MTVRNDWVAHLRRYPLRELRRRQRIANAQLKIAYQLAQQPYTRDRGLRGMTEIQDMLDSLAETIGIKYCYEQVE